MWPFKLALFVLVALTVGAPINYAEPQLKTDASLQAYSGNVQLVPEKSVTEQKECSKNDDCASGFCNTNGVNKCTNGMSGAKCDGDDECAPGWFCDSTGDNNCRPKNGALQEGSHCESDEQARAHPTRAEGAAHYLHTRLPARTHARTRHEGG